MVQKAWSIEYFAHFELQLDLVICFRKYYRAYLHYLEEAEPKVSNHTGYMKNMYKHILTVIDTLERCGYDKLLTFCHGDAKPNNFLFRNIEIDIEELECEGIQSILIDWQVILNRGLFGKPEGP